MGHLISGKVKTIVIPLFVTMADGITFEAYKEKTGIDLRDYFEFVDGPEDATTKRIYLKSLDNTEIKVQVMGVEADGLGFSLGVFPLVVLDNFDVDDTATITYISKAVNNALVFDFGLRVTNDNKIIINEL